jgi:hypothetical protein
LVLPVSGADGSDRFLRDWVECPYPGSVSLDGIIAYLSRKRGGSVIGTGAVSVTASGVASPQSNPQHYLLRVLTDFSSGTTHFITPNVANSWVCYDFGNGRIRPTHYAIRSQLNYNGHHLRSWKFEGSIDG